MDINIKLPNKQVLRGFINSPGENPRAGMILVHGVGEHIGRYSHWVKKFSEKRIAFIAVDLPGHGRSEGKRGHIKSYSVTSGMLDILIREYRKTFPGVPVFLYGHSLGAGIVLDYLIKIKPPVRGAIITSPWLKLSFEPDRLKILLVRVLKNILPSLVLPSGLAADHISRDKTVVDNYLNDPLVHDKISLSLVNSAFSAGRFSLGKASEINIPMLVLHGSDDKITSPEASREFALKNDKVTLRIWEGGYHELHNESFKDDVFDEIITWINKHI